MGVGELRYEVFGADAGGFDSAAEDGGSCYEDSPGVRFQGGYHAAPITERPMSKPTPRSPQEYGLVSVKNFPGENCSPAFVKSMST